MPLHVSSTCAHHQEVKIALHSLWYHHIYRCIKLVKCRDKYKEMHSQQNVRKLHVSGYSGYRQVVTAVLLYELYIMYN